MLLELTVNQFMMPPAKRGNESYKLKCVAGDSCFLTFWILVVQTVVQVANMLAELSLFLAVPPPGLLMASYSSAVFFDAMGAMFTLLFLKFCYFDAGWQVDIKEYWERHGVPMGARCLVSHVISLPVGIADIFVRDPRFLQYCTPSPMKLAVAAAVVSVAYFTLIHATWAATGFQYWPYPFLHELNTFPKRLVLLVAIFAGEMVVLSLMYVMAVQYWTVLGVP